MYTDVLTTSATTLEAMKQYVDQLDSKLSSDVEYLKKVYKFTFPFLLEPAQKSLPLEILSEYWTLLLGPLYGDKLETWLNFLHTEWKKDISRDTWNMFFLFLQEWDKDPNLESYDDTAAWPSLIDEFVEYYKQHQ